MGLVRFNNDYRANGIVGLPEAFPQVAFTPSMEPNLGPAGVGWLIDTSSPVTYREVLNINAQGSTVQSRAVAQHPLSLCSPQVPANFRNCSSYSSPTAMIATAAALVGVAFALGLLQVVLIVGPAFAIGRRRQTRTLALVAAVGGDAGAGAGQLGHCRVHTQWISCLHAGRVARGERADLCLHG